MTIPQWTLLGFATWTLLLLVATVGVYRWGMILLRGRAVGSFRSDQLEGADWYQRGTRAHANCVENLPVLTGPTVSLTVVATLAAGAASDRPVGAGETVRIMTAAPNAAGSRICRRWRT